MLKYSTDFVNELRSYAPSDPIDCLCKCRTATRPVARSSEAEMRVRLDPANFRSNPWRTSLPTRLRHRGFHVVLLQLPVKRRLSDSQYPCRCKFVAAGLPQ